jgi:hypothetical protein
MKRWWIMAIVAMIALAVVVPSAAARNASPAIPLRADLAGEVHWEYPAPGSGCSVVTTVTESSGFATSMGRVTSLWTHCPAEAIDQDGRMVLKSQGGHELWGTYEYDDVEDGVLTVAVDGGTGRFVDATGTLTVVVEFIPQLLDGCDDPDDFECLDFDTPWPWWATLTGSVSH